MGPTIGYLPGVFDLFHVGHLNALRQARARCDVLVAGVVDDGTCLAAKGLVPHVPLEQRLEIVEAIGIVDAVYAERGGDKVAAWREVGYHRLFKGDDWRGTPKGDALLLEMAAVGAEVVWFPYTATTSSTALRARIASA